MALQKNKSRSGTSFAILDREVAVEYGLPQAVVLQELIQDMNYRILDKEGIIPLENGDWYFRYDDSQLESLFPYIELEVLKGIIVELEARELVSLWRGRKTDFLWISAGVTP